MIFFPLIISIFTIFLIPIFLKKENLGVNIYSFFLVVLFFQLIIRNVLIAFNLPEETYVQAVLLRGLNLNEVLLSPLVFFISSILIVSSYMIFRNDKNFKNFNSAIPFLNKNPNEKKILFWCFIFFIISLISNYIFFIQFDLSLISFYRGTSASIEEYSAQGYLRLLAGVSEISAFVGLAYFWQSKRKYLKYLFLFLSILSFLLLIVGAVLSSSRAIILVALVGVFVLAKLSNKKVKVVRSLILSVSLISLVTFMTVYRVSEDRNELSFEIFKDYLNTPLYLIVNQGGIDVIKTQHLINYVREKEDYRYGEMFSNIVLLAIPRSLWIDKPVNIDTQFGMSVYNADVYGSGGVPPGILGEFFWDFSWIGLILASLVFGMIMGLLDKMLKRYMNSIFIKVLFASSLIWTGMGILGSGLVSFFIGVMSLLIPLLIMFLLSSLTLKVVKFEKTI